ncbi:MAG: DUF333 domain-containing protein [Candidatus Diapherotrites archaeon]
MTNQKNILLLALALTLFSGCIASPNPPLGGDADSHGCIGSAGYTWCEEKQKCIRIWEEECTNNQIANPASVNCINQGGTLNIITDEEGAQQGMCTLPNGKTCEEWAYYRGECGIE